jgi:2-phosphosulfolactate phosphatase
MTNRTLEVALLPQLIAPDALVGRGVIVIDVLRATTTITAALAAGACEVLPVAEVATALGLAAQPREPRAVLGGERRGVQIEGFDFGNSPREYTPQSVGGRTVIFTTTNGTQAMEHAKQARRIWCGAFVNAAAVVRAAVGETSLVLLCAGTAKNVTREDALLAGCLVWRLAALDEQWQPDRATWNDQAQLVADAWRSVVKPDADPARWPGSPEQIAQLALELRNSRGGRNLKALGLERDIDDAAQTDRYAIAPELDVAAWRIVV